MISHKTPYFTVVLDTAGIVVRVLRSSAVYPDVTTLERDMDSLSVVLDRMGRDRKLCVDLREGPLRNDPVFEEAFLRVLPRFFRGYRAIAIVVRTAVGSLQVKRHMREISVIAEVFHDEQEAIDYLRAVGGTTRRPTLLPQPSAERSNLPSLRGDKVSTMQLQAIDRPSHASSRSDRPSTLPPLSHERPSTRTERLSTLPPPSIDRASSASHAEDHASSLSPAPNVRRPRSS